MAQEKAEKRPSRRERFGKLINDWITGVFAGLSPRELRSMARGEPPGRPNPRYRVHNVSFWVHMKPRWYPKSVTRITYTFALGWTSAFLAVVLGVTGIILMLFYRPSVDTAYFDMLEIIGDIPFGKAMRDIHRLGAELMVAIVTLHLLRVFVTGSYKQPRSFNWLVGMTLLLITLAFSFTGYLLPWDQLAYWAITIGTNVAESIPLIGTQLQALLLGGATVGQLGLLRFYTIHVLVLPVLLGIFFGVHYHKVVRQNISLPPAVESGAIKEKETDRVSFLPDVLIREVLWVMIGLLILIVAVSTFYEAPLEDHANPFVTPLHSTAPWYFLWLQGLIKLPDIFGGIVEGKFVYGVILPGIFLALLFALPYLDRNPSRRWQDRKLALGVAAVVIVLMGILTWMGTPAYKVQASAQEEVALEFVPTDREGHIHEIAWDQLVDGTYSTTQDTNVPNAPQLNTFMEDLAQALEREADELPNAAGTLTIATWQRELKRVDLDITWQAEGQERAFNQYVYIHQNAAP